ncbi:ubiquitin-related domain-containing protein, partial [Mycena sanguinolenta]
MKLVIEDLTGMPADHQRIQHLGRETAAKRNINVEYDMPELQDDQTFESYGIVDGSVLYLSDKEAVILFVKMLTGKTLEISISLKAPVLSLKEDIQTKEGISPGMALYLAHQRLICSGKQLADHLPLSSYNIQNKSILHFVPSLRGG